MKIKVTLVLIPSFERMFVAFNPSVVIGILTTTLSCHLAMLLASSTIASAVNPVTSALIGPSTMSQISLITVSKSRPSREIMVGLVVTPSTTPSSLIALIAATLAVSRKNFISYLQKFSILLSSI
ncbi:conserved hypothetical protein [Streptococcus dysgalactiae subsp. equisimilis GGS_124]|nr:conserved hypothetical protein [Streptococcus dysgalactiae subsp. equisimilis GGS_124]